jgi:hypothetical protein
MRLYSPAELDRLGLPLERLVISSGFASKSGNPPSRETGYPPTGSRKRARREMKASDEAAREGSKNA